MRRRAERITALGLSLVASLTACSGDVGGSSDDATQGTALPRASQFQCKPSAAPPAQPLKRLTRVQLRNTVYDLVDRFAPSYAVEIRNAMESALQLLPADIPGGTIGGHGGGFFQFDQVVQQGHADALNRLGNTLGAQLTSTSARRTEVFGSCATNSSTTDDSSCLTTFLQRFGARVLRRPLSAADLDFYRGAKRAEDPSAVAPEVLTDAVSLLLQSPELLYAVELGAEADAGSLGSYELANRLSYHFWQAPPDDALWSAAAAGELLTNAGFRVQVDRLSSAPQAQAAIDDFFTRWLRIDELPELDGLLSTPKYAAYVGADRPGPNTREAAIDDVLFAARFQMERGGTLSDLLTSRASFARDPLLARIYGAPVWDGASEPPLFGTPGRSGLLGRAAFVMTGAARTRPILKGARIRQSLLCEELPPPPASATAVPVDPSPDETTRERVERVTESLGTNCAGCHVSRINPLGFASEGFDGLGRERSLEQIFDETGNKLASRSVRTDSVPQVIPGDTTPSQGLADLHRLLDQSGRVHSCFARMSFRFTFGREEEAGDGCGLTQIESLALQNRPLLETWREMAFLQQFRKRVLP